MDPIRTCSLKEERIFQKSSSHVLDTMEKSHRLRNSSTEIKWTQQFLNGIMEAFSSRAEYYAVT